MLVPAPTIVAADEAYKLSAWRDIVVVDWISVPSLDRCGKFRSVITETSMAHPRVTVIVRVRAPMVIPPPEVREALTRLIRDSESYTAGWSVALEGDGFWAAAHRAFSYSMHMLSSSKTRMRIFKEKPEAARWAAEVSIGKHSPTDLMTLIEETALATK